jgi:hypothetical protein
MRRSLATAHGGARSAPAARLGSGRSPRADPRRQTRLEAQALGMAAIQARLGPKFTPHLAVETVETSVVEPQAPGLLSGASGRLYDARPGVGSLERGTRGKSSESARTSAADLSCEHAFVTSQGSLRHRQRAPEDGSRGYEFALLPIFGEEDTRARRPIEKSRRALGGRTAGEPPAGSRMVDGDAGSFLRGERPFCSLLASFSGGACEQIVCNFVYCSPTAAGQKDCRCVHRGGRTWRS